jgi:hypothetical protein
MTQIKNTVEPFGEVNIRTSGGKVEVTATILMQPTKEGTQTGIALDGSGSMSDCYAMPKAATTGFFGSLFGSKPVKVEASSETNLITPTARSICALLARELDADGGTTCIYWATGAHGSQIEVVGDLTADQAEKHVFAAPKDYGTGTQLLPAVQYFVNRFSDAPWGFYVFLTDGELHDLDAVKDFSTRLAREIASGKRKPLKFVLIGVGNAVKEAQMEELDDLDTGTSVDLWDHKIAREMRQTHDIFAEVVEENARVADTGKIYDDAGRVVKDYSDIGLPARLSFALPVGSKSFTLEVNGQRITQLLG